MSSDINKKTLRHFYCRDALWQSFERMSEDFDRGIDDLVNEAMRVFAREKGYLAGDHEPRATGQRPAHRPPPLPPPVRPTGSHPTARPAPPAPPAPAAGAQVPPLYLVFQGQKYVIDKEQFIIGRGSKSSDLPIRDGNVSRKHAAVIRRNGAYYIKDLGSTNGIDYNGMRIDNKRIEEGDLFTICDYELRFTFR